VFALFVAASATQYLIFAWFHHNLGARFESLALRSPVAIALSEFVAPRIFGWQYGHAQVAFTPLVQAADIAGATFISFLMFWLAEAAVRAVVFRERRRAFLLPVVAVGLALGYGAIRVAEYAQPEGEKLTVVLVQGNIPIEEYHNPDALMGNVRKLLYLSQRSARADSLVVWPENSIPVLLPEPKGSVRRSRILPWLANGSAFLVGSYVETADEIHHIAVFCVFPDERIPAPYYKQILMPFGEYVPGSSIFPWLERLNANSGGFRAGTEAKVFEIPMRNERGAIRTVRVSPLVCYEDIVPALSREATRQGAELLVNLTNDTWFGRTVAPLEHHLIASFRAIENRRFLVRATNTGLTAVVDPLGRTVARIPLFTEGTVTAPVVLLSKQSAFTRFVGDWPWWCLLGVCATSIGAGKLRTIRSKRSEPEQDAGASLGRGQMSERA
jgi:apolipoprotein N-acyltransferase